MECITFCRGLYCGLVGRERSGQSHCVPYTIPLPVVQAKTALISRVSDVSQKYSPGSLNPFSMRFLWTKEGSQRDSKPWTIRHRRESGIAQHRMLSSCQRIIMSRIPLRTGSAFPRASALTSQIVIRNRHSKIGNYQWVILHDAAITTCWDCFFLGQMRGQTFVPRESTPNRWLTAHHEA